MATSKAFPLPNYTQTPNDFFEMIPDMGDAELRVTLVMIRHTFGFHRNSFKMGVSKLATASGLSRQGALDGAEAAEKRGTFRRTNPDSNTEAEWELVVALNPVDTPLNPVEGSPQPSGGLSGVKESIKEINTPAKAEVPDNYSIEWQIAGNKVSVKMRDEQAAKMIDAANLICTGIKGVNYHVAYGIAYTFMQTRGIVIPESKIKSQRKPLTEMIEMGVLPNHAQEATKKLMESNMTITDLYSISKTAIDIANKSNSKPVATNFETDDNDIPVSY